MAGPWERYQDTSGPWDRYAQQGEQAGPSIDFNRADDLVRGDIAKLQGDAREKALSDWATARVAKEREQLKKYDTIPGAANPFRFFDVARNLARGTLAGSFADELKAGGSAALNKATGGAVGAPYDEAVAYERATNKAISEESPGISTALQVGGAFATGAPIAKGAFKLAEKALPRYVAVPAAGAAVGGTAGLVAGVGEGEGDLEKRLEHAIEGEGLLGLSPVEAGLGIGAVLPPLAFGGAALASKAHEIASPVAARLAANAREIPRRIGISASADGATPETAGARAAAEQMIANQLAREGIRPGQLPARLDQVEDATKYWSSGQAQDTTALVDLTPGLQRLAGSAVRANPEAGNVAKTFIEGRQTGVTPASGADYLASVGIHTRPKMSRPMTAEQARERFGTDFAAGAKNPVPAGQDEGILDGLRRVMLLHDEKFHGHQATGFQTVKSKVKELKDESDKRYPVAWKTAEDFDISQAFDNLRQIQAQVNDKSVENLLNRVMRLFSEKTGNGAPLGRAQDLQRVDLAKQRLDGLIDRFKGSDSFLYRALVKFKQDVLDAVHGGDRLNATRNKAYAEARDFYSSQKEALEAFDMGRKAFRGDSDEALEFFRGIETEGMRKMFRLGVIEGYRVKAGDMKLGGDKTQLFDNKRIQNLLSEVIPRDLTDTGRLKTAKTGPDGRLEPTKGATRPEVFGRYLDDKRAQVETRNTVLGGSQTQKNKRDDDAFDIMSAWNEIKETSASTTAMLVKGAAHLLSQVFGMREDTAAAIARMLFTADPIQRRRILLAVEQRLGSSRMEQFVRLMNEYQRTLTTAGARQGAMPENE